MTKLCSPPVLERFHPPVSRAQFCHGSSPLFDLSGESWLDASPRFFCAARWADVAFVWRKPARMRGRPVNPHTSAQRAPRRGANGCADVRFRLVPQFNR